MTEKCRMGFTRAVESTGFWTADSYSIMQKQVQEEERRQKAERISELKGLLAATDYIAAKISEGAATREEYADKLTEPQSWRDEINAINEA